MSAFYKCVCLIFPDGQQVPFIFLHDQDGPLPVASAPPLVQPSAGQYLLSPVPPGDEDCLSESEVTSFFTNVYFLLQVSNEDERQSFVEDYRMTACVSILQWFCMVYLYHFQFSVSLCWGILTYLLTYVVVFLRLTKSMESTVSSQ